MKNPLKGWTTIIAGAVITALGSIEAADLIDVVPDQYVGVVMAAIGLAMIWLRAITNTPIGSAEPEDVQNLKVKLPAKIGPEVEKLTRRQAETDQVVQSMYKLILEMRGKKDKGRPPHKIATDQDLRDAG